MKKQKTPQEKKELSYKKDRRNVYGENDKASRKAIPRRKKEINKKYRKKLKQTLQSSIKKIDKILTTNEEELEILSNSIQEVKREKWEKMPDKPLGKYIKDKNDRKKRRTNNN